jgi:DNA polymerase-3 subunit epsilon
LLDECIRPRTVVSADGSPFASKDILKLRGYQWNMVKKVWARSVHDSDLKAEIEWLEKNVYGGAFRGTTLAVPCLENFRIG